MKTWRMKMTKTCNKSFEDRTLKEEFLCSLKSVSKIMFWGIVFMLFVIQTALNLNMMSDIQQLQEKVNGKNEFHLKSEIQLPLHQQKGEE